MFLTTIKSNHTFNQTLKIYTQTTEKVFLKKITFFQPQQLQQKQTHSKLSSHIVYAHLQIKE
jgi:hypothetical protein